MDNSLGKRSYAEYRSELLQRALKEKKNLGLDGVQASVCHSPALQALRCYGLEAGDSASFDEPEETVSNIHTSERRKTIDIHPKQLKAVLPYREQQSNSSADKKGNKPLKSILKRTESPSDSAVSSKPHSAINTPFFLSNAENEAEYLYGKSINEQSLRVSALYAESKSNGKGKSKEINLDVRNRKTPENLFDSKSGAVDLDTRDSKAPPNSSGGRKQNAVTDIFAQDSEKSSNHPVSDKNKNSGTDFNSQSLKKSSNLSGYAALLNFSRSTLKVQPKTKNAPGSGSLQESETCSAKKPSKPDVAQNDNPKSKLCSPNKKTPEAKSVASKSNFAAPLNPAHVPKDKPVSRWLPRSVQQLQSKKSSLEHSFVKKDTSFETVVEKVSSTGSPYNSVRNSLSKRSENDIKCDVKPLFKNVDTKKSVDSVGKKESKSDTAEQKVPSKCASGKSTGNDSSKNSGNAPKTDAKPLCKNILQKNDELLLLKYVRRNTRSAGENIKPGTVMKPINSDSNAGSIVDSVDKKESRSDTAEQKAPSKCASGKSTGNDSSKNSGNAPKTDVKPLCKNVPQQDDEMLLLKYVRRTTRSTGEKNKPGTVNSDSNVGSIVHKIGRPSVTLNIKDFDSKSLVGASSTVQRPEATAELKNKCTPSANPVALDVKECAPKTSLNTGANEIFSTSKKQFLSKLSSIKQKKNYSFLNHGKRRASRHLLAKRPLKKPMSSVDPTKGYGCIAKEKEFLKEKHSFSSASEKRSVDREPRNKGVYKGSYASRSENNTYSFHSSDFSSGNNVGNSPRNYDAERSPIAYMKKGRHSSRSDVSPKRDSFYSHHSRETFDESPGRYSFGNSPQRHSLDWSPERKKFHDRTRKQSLECSPGRYSFDGSPKRQPLGRSPVRHPFSENDRTRKQSLECSPGRYSFDGSPERQPLGRSPVRHPFSESLGSHSFERNDNADSFSGSPAQYFYDRSPDPHAYDGDLSPAPYNRTAEQDLYDRSPEPGPYDKSHLPRPYGRSPDPYPCSRSPVPHYHRSPDSYSHDRSSRRQSYDGSPEPELFDVNSGSRKWEISPRRHARGRQHRVHSFDNSPERFPVDRSPRRRLSDERSSERFSFDMSPRSSRQISIDRSSGRPSVELSPRRTPFDRQSKSSCSPERRKSRFDRYHDSPGKTSGRNRHKNSRERLKHRPRSQSPKAVLFDSSDRLSERSLKSDHSDLSRNAKIRVPLDPQQVDAPKNPRVEGYRSLPIEKEISSSLIGISQQPQDLQKILVSDLIIPDVNKIMNAIDTLASNYYNEMENQKACGPSQNLSVNSLNSLSRPCVQNPTQLPSVPVYPSTYEQPCFSQANSNTPRFAYNSGITTQASYPSYNVSSANSYPSQYPTAFPPQSSDTASFYPVPPSSSFCSPSVAPPTYSNASISVPPFGTTVQSPVNCAPVQPVPFNTTSTPSAQQTLTDELAVMYPGPKINYVDNGGGGSLERVRTLTSIPLQSDKLSDEKQVDKSEKENTSKSQSVNSPITMKFITPDKIEKLLSKKSDIRKQITALNCEYEKLQKMQGDAMRMKRREKDGHKDAILLEYGKFQDEIKSQLKNLLDDMKDVEQELKNGFLGCTSENEARMGYQASKGDNEKGSEKTDGPEEREETPYYEFYDSGSHWCKYCNKLCTTVGVMLEHLKSEEHQELTSLIDKSWASSSSEEPVRGEQKGQKIVKPVKGVQFIMPVEGFYCSLCKEYFENSHIRNHLKSSRHYEAYQNYTLENPRYEHRWLLDRLASLSQTEVEESKQFSKEGKDQKKEKGRKSRWSKDEKEDEMRWKEEEKGKSDVYQKLRQMDEERVNVKEKLKYKDEGKNKCNTVEEREVEDAEDSRHSTDIVEKLNHEKEERKNVTHSKEQNEIPEQREVEIKTWGISCSRQEEKKRKRGEETEAVKKKLRIADTSEQDAPSSEKLESTEDANDQPLKKQGKTEVKWAVQEGQKKSHLVKGSESKSKPKQTVVYIGRAPNFKSHNKGKSSFREHLLKLALQKKECDDNSNKDNEATSSSTSVSESVKPNSADFNKAESTSYSVGCESRSTQQPSENVSSCVSTSANLSDSVNYSNFPIKIDTKRSTEGRKTKRRMPVQGPVTEEDEDFRLLSINREDMQPLVNPKPPPIALIQQCLTGDKSAHGKVPCDKVAPITSGHNVSNVQQWRTNMDNSNSLQSDSISYSGVTQSVTNTVQSRRTNVSAAPQNYDYMCDVSVAQEQDVNYFQNVRGNIPVSHEPLICTGVSDAQHYPNMGNDANFQDNFMMRNDPYNTTARLPPQRQFQNPSPQAGYNYRGAPPPECYNQNPGNFYYGEHPQRWFPPPNVNAPRNYCPPRFQMRNFGRCARMPRPPFKKKLQYKQNETQSSANNRGKSVGAGIKQSSPLNTEKQPMEKTESEKPELPKAILEDSSVSTVSLDSVGNTQKSLVAGSRSAATQEDCTVVEHNKIPVQNMCTFNSSHENSVNGTEVKLFQGTSHEGHPGELNVSEDCEKPPDSKSVTSQENI